MQSFAPSGLSMPVASQQIWQLRCGYVPRFEGFHQMQTFVGMIEYGHLFRLLRFVSRAPTAEKGLQP
jgi:hypothetical protein